ncbi:hypothetical protein [Aliidiomarina soli]|nr:hypothetical protein [Aliidiomarina soli]
MDFSSLDYRLISTIASVVMTLAWVAYLHLALTQYMRANRPFLVIQHAHENDPSALCLFVNLSKEPVHLQAVIARVHRGDECTSYRITNYERITATEQHVQSKLRQGPIQPGGYLVLGSFADIMLGNQSADESSSESTTDQLSQIASLELCVAVVYASKKHHIGARRHFFLEHLDEKTKIHAYSIFTEQLVRRKHRHTVREWVKAGVDPWQEQDTADESQSQSSSSIDKTSNRGT